MAPESAPRVVESISLPPPPAAIPAPPPNSPAAAPVLESPPSVKHGGVISLGAEGLLAFVPDLERLAETALEANPFFELPMLAPALRHLRDGAKVELVLVFAADPNPQRPARLAGFFPVEHVKRWNGLPVSALRVWKHPHSFLGAPLIAKDLAEETIAQFLDWAKARAPIVEMRTVPCEGAFDHALTAVLHRRGATSWISKRWLRATMTRAADAESYLRDSVSGRTRKELRRLQRLLGELGGVLAFDTLAPGEDAHPWVQVFLALEASGWKGNEGSALASKESHAAFFEEAVLGAHRRGRVEMLRLRIGDRVIATKCNMRSASGAAFAVKIAFDESLSRFSPGVLLELENVRHLHRAGGPQTMDSCADPDHPMIDRLWSGRRALHSVAVSTGARGGAFWLSIAPLLGWMKKAVRR